MRELVGTKLYEVGKTEVGAIIVGFAFSRFSKLLPVKKVHQTDKVVAFWHPKPSWEKHIVIVPKTPIRDLLNVNEAQCDYIAGCMVVAGEIVKKFGWEKKRWSVVVHGGSGQKVKQLHFHLNCGKLLEKRL